MPLTLTLAACLLVAADDRGRNTDAKVMTTLDGTWRVTSFVVGGVGIEQAVGGLFAFRDGRLSMEYAGLDGTAIYKVDESKSPATIDKTTRDGPRKGLRTEGIFEVKDGQLRLCFSATPGRGRPERFASEKEWEILITLKRVGPPKP